jgi:hypothetical protein
MPNVAASPRAAVIEANINAYPLSFARLPGAVLHDGAHSTSVDSGAAEETYNSVVRARFSAADVDAGIESVLAKRCRFFRRGRRRGGTWQR